MAAPSEIGGRAVPVQVLADVDGHRPLGVSNSANLIVSGDGFCLFIVVFVESFGIFFGKLYPLGVFGTSRCMANILDRYLVINGGGEDPVVSLAVVRDCQLVSVFRLILFRFHLVYGLVQDTTSANPHFDVVILSGGKFFFAPYGGIHRPLVYRVRYMAYFCRTLWENGFCLIIYRGIIILLRTWGRNLANSFPSCFHNELYLVFFHLEPCRVSVPSVFLWLVGVFWSSFGASKLVVVFVVCFGFQSGNFYPKEHELASAGCVWRHTFSGVMNVLSEVWGRKSSPFIIVSGYGFSDQLEDNFIPWILAIVVGTSTYGVFSTICFWWWYKLVNVLDWLMKCVGSPELDLEMESLVYLKLMVDFWHGSSLFEVVM